uniref:hypothetical protein n=1 Tax=Rhizobium sp. F40D2 TaxID=3453141 RepID=UPI003F25232F
MANRAIWLSGSTSWRRPLQVPRRPLRAILVCRMSSERRSSMSPGHADCRHRRAGAGKTTMMKAALEAWETAGYRMVSVGWQSRRRLGEGSWHRFPHAVVVELAEPFPNQLDH